MTRLKAALSLVRNAGNILLSGHLRADGDCLGSESVLFHAFRALGKSVRVINPDVPDQRYGFLHEHTPFEVYKPGELPDYDLIVISDCSMLTRLGAMGEEVRSRDAARIAVDHHLLEDADRGQWTAMVHDVGAPASGLLALQFVRELGAELPVEALEAAFVSLATDTGWFKYSNADAAAWKAASDLVGLGVVPEKLYRAIYQACDGGRPRGVGAALSTVEYHRDGRLALAWLTQEMLANSGGTLEDTDEVLDLLRSVQEVEAVGFLYERSPGRVKASLRSKTEIDVNSVARSLGGGGHARAAGISFDEGVQIEEAVERVREAMLQAFDAMLATR